MFKMAHFKSLKNKEKFILFFLNSYNLYYKYIFPKYKV
jgi:hypothetical protein